MRAASSSGLAILAALFLSGAAVAFGQTSSLRTHTETIRASSCSFQLDVGGTIDPENVEIVIENAGGVPVMNPRVTVNGKYDWYTLESLAAEITRGWKTEEEKAMAIFDFEARIYEIWHHTVAEAKWDGQWHQLDPDLEVWHLRDDNRTIASMADLEAHPEWVARTHKPCRRYLTPDNRKAIYKPEAEVAGPEMGNIYGTASDNYVETGYDEWIYKPQSMDFTLWPDQVLTRWWKPVLRKHYDQARSHEPPRYANGRIVFEPDFTRRTYEGLVKRRNVAFKAEDGVSPAVHVARPQDPQNDRPSSLTLTLQSPYVIVGGYIDTTYYKGGTSGLDQVSLSAVLDPILRQSTSLWNFYGWAYGMGESRAVLDAKMVKDGPVATYQISATYTLSADKRHEGPPVYPLVYGGQSGVDRVRMVADLQVNPGSLPALSLGRNSIRYSDETAGDHLVKVTYKWRERHDQHPPGAPEAAAAPADGAAAVDLTPRLSWAPSKDPDGDRIVNYRVQVSLRPDCAWPVVATLDRDVRDGAAFQVPKGWLNRATTYYWRVRAEDGRGNFGPWSKIFRFTTR